MGSERIPSSLAEFICRLGGATERESTHDVLCFATNAHTLTIQQRVDELLRLLSGIVALFRNSDDTSRFCRIATLRTQDEEIRFYRGDASRVEGFAVAGPTRLEVEPVATIRSNVESETVGLELQFETAILPVDQEELIAVKRQIAVNPFVALIFRMIAFGGRLESGIGQLQKAFHFWSRGELQRRSISEEHYSVWSISDAFLAYCTVAEILAGAKENVTELMASRLASVLSDAPDNRAEIYRQIKILYGKRSRYVHGGEAVIRYDDLLQLREIVRTSLIYAVFWSADVLSRRFAEASNNTGDLRDIFEQTLWPIIQSSKTGTFQDHCDAVRFGMPRIVVQPPTENGSFRKHH